MEIRTERLLLREFVESDFDAVLAYQQDPRYHRYYETETQTEEGVWEFIQMFLGNQVQDPRLNYQLAVVLQESGELIGNCGVRLRKPGTRVGDIGYELNPDHWGRGFATEAARAMAAFGFEQLGLHRLWSWCIADNIGSWRVMEKIGMQLEGRQRENEFFKERWWDTLIYGMLEDEWN